jgi:Domain of unknown function (DUF6883)
MKLPNSDRAVVDIRKIRDYCLNPEHRRGRHKARVFAAALGLTSERSEELRNALVAAARDGEAMATGRDQYGQRFVLDFPMAGPGGGAMIRSRWIVLNSEDFPRLTTCHVLRKEANR